jgi:signal transduction histidine kinase
MTNGLFAAAARRLAGALEAAMNRPEEGSAVAWSCLIAMLVVGVGDYATGVETTFTLLYLFPLAYGAWSKGRNFGIVLAVVATLCSALAVVLTSHPPIRPLPLIWNDFASLLTMLFVVWILTALHAYVDQERTTRELAVEQLRHAERLNIIGKLAAGVAHELGTPLNVISGSAEMLEGGELNRAYVTKYSTTILEQTKKMTAIIRHLLDFGRRGGSSRVTLDLNEAVTRAVELLLPMARKSNSSLLVETSDHPVLATVNPAEIEQVFSNLVVNALQAVVAGGAVMVRVSVEPRETVEATFRPFGRVTVEDNGAGIEEQFLSHVFDPFFTTKGVGEGTGLGLSVSYGIVHDHGGQIEVTSEPGNGARFTVLLPLATSQNRQAAQRPRPLR